MLRTLVCASLAAFAVADTAATAAKSSPAASEPAGMDYKKLVPDFKQYMPKMSKNDSTGFIPDYEKFLDMDKYTRFAKFMADAKGPTSAEKCNTTKQLDEWRTRMEAPMKAFVPKQWRAMTESHFEQEYEQNLKRIQNASAAMEEKASENAAPARLLLAASAQASAQDKEILALKAALKEKEKEREISALKAALNNKSQELAAEDPPALKPAAGGTDAPAEGRNSQDASEQHQADSSVTPANGVKQKASSSQQFSSYVPDFNNYFKDYQGFMHGDSAPDYQRYMPQGASGFGSYLPQHGATDYSNLVPEYEQYMNVQKYMEFAVLLEKQQAPASAEMCKTRAELDAWRKAREAPIKAFVPKDYQHYTMDSIKAEYNKNEARIEAAEKELRQEMKEAAANATKPPARMLLEASAEASKDASGAPQKKVEQAEQPQQPQVQKDGKAFDYKQFVPDYAKYMDYQKHMNFAQFVQDAKAPNKAQDCKSKADLDAWRSVQEATAKEYVPKEWQDAPMAAIQKKYEQNLARIKAEKAAAKAAAKPEAMNADQLDSAATDVESSSTSDDKTSGFHWPLLLTTRFAALHAQSAINSEKLLVATESAESQKYVPNYANYMDVEKFAALSNSVEEMHAPEQPSDCKTMKELDAWSKKQKAILKKYVPSAYVKHPLASLEKTYKSNEARIKAAASNSTATLEAPKVDQLAAVAAPTGLPLIACGVLVGMLASLALRLSRRASQDGALEENLLLHDAPLAA